MSAWLSDPHVQTVIGLLIAVVSTTGTYIKQRAAGRTMARVELNVNGRMSALIARVDQLTAALTAVNADVPTSPHVLVDPAPTGDIIVIKNALKENE